MDIDYITKLIELISESKVDEIEIEEEGKKIRIAKTQHGSTTPQQVIRDIALPESAPSSGVPQMPVPSPSNPAESAAPATKFHEIRSPIVGTFYRAPAPDAPPFVEVGATIQKGTVLCIVEAMKLMNEIESDYAGKLVQVLVQNGEPVEYDQVLFLVQPA